MRSAKSDVWSDLNESVRNDLNVRAELVRGEVGVRVGRLEECVRGGQGVRKTPI